MAPRARWLPSSSSQQRVLLPWVGVEWTHTVFERAARRTECVVWSACEVVEQQTMKAADKLLLIRRTPARTVLQTCGLRANSSVDGRGDARACAEWRRGASGVVLAMGEGRGLRRRMRLCLPSRVVWGSDPLLLWCDLITPRVLCCAID
jgi:hypothetical protein